MHMVRTDWENLGRGCSTFFLGNIKVGSLVSHWLEVLQEVVTEFYYRYLKDMDASGPYVHLFSFSLFLPLQCLPNDMCCLYVILLIIILRMELGMPCKMEGWNVSLLFITVPNKCICRIELKTALSLGSAMSDRLVWLVLWNGLID